VLCIIESRHEITEEGEKVKITFETAEEMGNALLDAVALAKEHDEEVVITSTKENNWISLIGEQDCGTRFIVEPPVKEPDEPHLQVVA